MVWQTSLVLRTSLRRFALVFYSLGSIFISPNAAADRLLPGLEIHVLNVGQGDSTLVVGPPPDRRLMLIDIGEEMNGRKDHYKDIADKIRKYAPGHSTIDYVVISHFHFDHMGAQNAKGGDGIWGLIEQSGFKVNHLIDRGDTIQFGAETSVHQKLRGDIATWKQSGKLHDRQVAHLGADQIDLGSGVIVKIVAVNGNGILERTNQSRPDYFDRCPPSENDYSVAVKISYGNFDYYSGGDLAGQSTDRVFPNSGCTSYNDVESEIANAVGNVEVMKINHHGSLYSSNPLFMDVLSPEFMIVTSGSQNDYEHPSKEVMARAIQKGMVFVTGGVSDKAWPSGTLLAGMRIVGDDINIYVEKDGGRYEILGEVHPAFSPDQKANGEDRKYVKDIILKQDQH